MFDNYWTSILWLIDSFQNKVSADQYHMTISWAQVISSSRSHVSFKLTSDPLLVFPLDRWLKLGYDAGGRRGYVQRQISVQIDPWHIVHFSSDIFLAQLYFGNYALSNYMLTIDHFLIFWYKKSKSSFSCVVIYCNQELCFKAWLNLYILI